MTLFSSIHAVFLVLLVSSAQSIRIKADKNDYCLEFDYEKSTKFSIARLCQESNKNQANWERIQLPNNLQKFAICMGTSCLTAGGEHVDPPGDQALYMESKNIDDPKQQWSYNCITKVLTNSFVMDRKANCVLGDEICLPGPQCMFLVSRPHYPSIPRTERCDPLGVGHKFTFVWDVYAL